MKTSCIRHPEHSYFVRRHKWQIEALAASGIGKGRRTEIPHCAAEILSVFEYHYNNRFANRILRQLIDTANRRNTGPLRDVGDWMPYSIAYLSEILLGGRGRHVLLEALAELEAIGFVSTDVPDDIIEFYSNNMKWYRLNVDVINQWIDTNIAKSWVDNLAKDGPRPTGLFGSQPDDPEDQPSPSDGHKKPGRKPKATATIDDGGKSETKTQTQIWNSQAEQLCEFYKHIHGKNKNFVFDSNRRTKVVKQLQAHRTMGQCAQAIIGNVLSDYHQGRHDNNMLGKGGKIFDDIELIFRNAKNFEKHLGYAEDNGVIEEIALIHFEAFLAGEPSVYAKKDGKMAQTASKRETEATDDKPKLSDVEERRYRDFGRTIASFIASDVENVSIFELCEGNEDLRTSGAGLVDAGVLYAAIHNGLKTFKTQGIPAAMQTQIRKFADAYAKKQEVNS